MKHWGELKASKEVVMIECEMWRVQVNRKVW